MQGKHLEAVKLVVNHIFDTSVQRKDVEMGKKQIFLILDLVEDKIKSLESKNQEQGLEIKELKKRLTVAEEKLRGHEQKLKEHEDMFKTDWFLNMMKKN